MLTNPEPNDCWNCPRCNQQTKICEEIGFLQSMFNYYAGYFWSGKNETKKKCPLEEKNA